MSISVPNSSYVRRRRAFWSKEKICELYMINFFQHTNRKVAISCPFLDGFATADFRFQFDGCLWCFPISLLIAQQLQYLVKFGFLLFFKGVDTICKPIDATQYSRKGLLLKLPNRR